MTGSMTHAYASKFTEPSQFVLEFAMLEQMKMRRFEKGLVFYIRRQLDGQHIHTYQDLYEQETEVVRIKSKLRALNPNPNNQKRK